MPPKKKAPSKSEKNGIVKEGKIKWKNEKSKVHEKALSILSNAINLNGFRWEIVDGLFQQANVKNILQVTVELSINHLGLRNNQNPNIIKEICIFDNYSKLETLIMPQNLIESVEALSKLNAPKLWRIDVRNNLINSLKPFQRVSWPGLSMLIIGKNKIAEVGEIWRIGSPILGWIDLQDNPTLTNVLPLLKFESNKIDQIYLYPCGLPQQPNLVRPFKRKCQKKIHYKIFKSYGQAQESEQMIN